MNKKPSAQNTSERPKSKPKAKSGKGPNAHPARLAALTGLLAIRDGRTMDEALNPLLPKLEERDRALAKRIATGTLRSMAALDKKAKQYLKTQLPAKAIRARLVLNMGLYQLADSDSPPYAVRSTCLDLLETRKSEAFKPLVDALLRRVGEDRENWRKEFQRTQALWLPRWLRDKWNANFGEEKVDSFTRAASAIPFTDLNFVSEQARKDFITALPDETAFLILSGHSLRLGTGHGPITKLPLFKEGQWWVQDFAATLPARILAESFADGLEGKAVLDLCAAPGGKSLQLAAMGAKVTAVEISEKRAKRLHQNLKRCEANLKGSIEVVVVDALKWEPETQWDAALLDAPCSASGTLRRHPEWPYLRTRETHLDNVKLQAKLMFQAANLLKDDGKLVYATCSMDPEEGPNHQRKVQSVLQPDPISADATTLPKHLIQDGFLRTFPDSSATNENAEPTHALSQGMDGFFAQLYRKT